MGKETKTTRYYSDAHAKRAIRNAHLIGPIYEDFARNWTLGWSRWQASRINAKEARKNPLKDRGSLLDCKDPDTSSEEHPRAQEESWPFPSPDASGESADS